MTPGTTNSGMNIELTARELVTQNSITGEGVNNSRLKGQEQSNLMESQHGKVQFVPTNNFFKNVSENKDVAKLVALLATCINSTRKVNHV